MPLPRPKSGLHCIHASVLLGGGSLGRCYSLLVSSPTSDHLLLSLRFALLVFGLCPGEVGFGLAQSDFVPLDTTECALQPSGRRGGFPHGGGVRYGEWTQVQRWHVRALTQGGELDARVAVQRGAQQRLERLDASFDLACTFSGFGVSSGHFCLETSLLLGLAFSFAFLPRLLRGAFLSPALGFPIPI